MLDIVLRTVDPQAPEHTACLAQYYAELSARFEGGFDPGVKAYSGEGKAGTSTHSVLACRGEEPIACASLVSDADGVGEIKRMWVSPRARGQGIARRLLEHLEAQARRQGLRYLRLDTNKALPEAHALYRAAGYAEIARYSDNPYAHHWFGKPLTEPRDAEAG